MAQNGMDQRHYIVLVDLSDTSFCGKEIERVCCVGRILFCVIMGQSSIWRETISVVEKNPEYTVGISTGDRDLIGFKPRVIISSTD